MSEAGSSETAEHTRISLTRPRFLNGSASDGFQPNKAREIQLLKIPPAGSTGAFCR